MGLKKSKFTAGTVIPAGSTFDFVSNGQNFKIASSDLLAALGVTGTLTQLGSVTGSPVLNIDATNYQIRSIEAGSNIVIGLSPDNGIIISASGTLNNPVVESFTALAVINELTNLVISTGTHTLTMPTSYQSILEIKSISGTATLDPGTNTFESGATVTAGTSRRMYLNATVWIEL